MAPEEFVDLVKRMRAKQTQYFANRDRTTLNESKDLERRVDRAIESYAKKPGLFDAEATNGDA